MKRVPPWLARAVGADAGHRAARLEPSYAAFYAVLSGLCAIVYQIAWLRQLRLIFGVSTAANAAAVGIFMVGLGLGGIWLGPRADRSRSPLRLYGTLELGIAVTAALTPLSVTAVRAVYLALGGTHALGVIGGSAAQLVLAVLVLGPPTLLMGGTLPAIARAVETRDDVRRRSTALLYGVNTLGAVMGAALATFVWLEMVGTRRMIWAAAVLNLLVGLAAHSRAVFLDRRVESASAAAPAASPGSATAAVVPRRTVLEVAALTGFVFFAMEAVWYRMLAPILGGSSYTFGLVLAVALLGIGLGGLLYSLRFDSSPTAAPTRIGLAVTCALEALALAVPFALGDRLVLLAAALRPLAGVGFFPLVLTWTAIAIVVVLPASVVAGYQFPLLLGLLGRGREGLGRDVGMAYAANTLGALAGSISSAFLLLPGLGAPMLWRLSVGALGVLAVVLVLPARRSGAAAPVAVARSGSARIPAVAVTLAVAAGALVTRPGPGPAWRHGGVGAGRMTISFDSANSVRRAFRRYRTSLVWEAEGRESSVALLDDDGFAFFVNGRSDGNARGDAPTAVMAGLVGAALHTDPRTALVIGLGTGSTAGWLAAVPGVERVDVVELEREVVRVAQATTEVNHDVLDDPAIELMIGDGRELLLTTERSYDVVVSNPSNPYRAGVAGFFTVEFYRAVERRLERDGVFVQWLQAYEVDSDVVRTVYATLSMVFPSVETWRSHTSDILLVATPQSRVHDVDRIERRIVSEPWASAMTGAWGVSGLEGFLSAHAGGPALTRGLVGATPEAISTDDHPLVEFGFARTAGVRGRFRLGELLQAARHWDAHRPEVRGRAVDWELVDELAEARLLAFGSRPEPAAGPSSSSGVRTQARRAFAEARFQDASDLWWSQPEPPRSRMDRLVALVGRAIDGADGVDEQLEMLAREQPIEAAVVEAFDAVASGEGDRAVDALVRAYVAYRHDPWAHRPLMSYSFDVAVRLAELDPELGRPLWEALAEPFAVHVLENERRRTRIELATAIDFAGLCVEAYGAFEPDPPWEAELLEGRSLCYDSTLDERGGPAQLDLMEYGLREPGPLLR